MNEHELAAAIVAAVTGHDEVAMAALADHLDERGLDEQAEQLRRYLAWPPRVPRQVNMTVQPGSPFAAEYQERPWRVEVRLHELIVGAIRRGCRSLNRRTALLFGNIKAREVRQSQAR
jgi:hypothetical protein